MTCGVYLITHIPTGGRYVGASEKMEYRWQQHQRALVQGVHHNPRMQALADEYGVDSFTFEILEAVDSYPWGIEREWIRQLQPELNLSDTLEATTKRKAQWTPEKRQQHGQMLRELWAKRKAPRPEDVGSAIEAAIATLEQHCHQLTAEERLRIRRVIG